MSASTVHCHILGGNITIISDLNGNVTNVVCPEFARLTHGCYKKNAEVGFLGALAAKVADKVTGATRAGHCEFGHPLENPLSRTLRRDNY